MSQRDKILTCGIAAGFLYALAIMFVLTMIIALACGDEESALFCMIISAGTILVARLAHGAIPAAKKETL